MNSDVYPYDVVFLYDMYSKFQQSYYLRDSQPLLTREKFKTIAPIIVIDVSPQNDVIKTGPIDIRIGIKILINIHLHIVQLYSYTIEYIPFTNEIKKTFVNIYVYIFF